MFVMEIEQDGTLEVDLTVRSNDTIGHEIVSIRDALMFLGYTNFVRGSTNKTDSSISNDGRYFSQILPSEGDVFFGLVAHVNSPVEIYAQKVSREDFRLRIVKRYVKERDVCVAKHWQSIES